MRVRSLLLIGAATLLASGCGLNRSTIIPPPDSNTSAQTPIASSIIEAQPTAGSIFANAAGATTPGIVNASQASTATPVPKTAYTVQRGTVVDAFSIPARIAAMQQALTFSQDGIVKSIAVEPMSKVKQGQLLVELDLGNLADQLSQAKTATEQDKRTLTSKSEAANLDIQRAQIVLDAANAKLAALQEPPAPDAITAARSDLSRAQASFATAQNNASADKNRAQQELEDATVALTIAQQQFGTASDYLKQHGASDKNAQAAYDKAVLTLHDAESRVANAVISLDTARGNEIAAVKNAQAAVDVAQARLDKLLNGPDKYDVAAAQREIQQATIDLKQAKDRAVPDSEITKRIAASELQIQQIESQIESRRMYAPFDGTVSGISGGVGASVRAGASVVLLSSDTARDIVSNAIDAKDSARVARLTVGQPVEITLSRYPGKTISGVVSQLPSRATGDDGRAGDLGYHISYSAPDLTLDIGDQANVNVTLGRQYDALWLPPAAVTIAGDNATVLIKEGDTTKRIPVTIGIISADRIEILSNLKENDVVFGA